GFLARGELTRQPTEMQNQLHDDQSVKARSYVVNYNSTPSGSCSRRRSSGGGFTMSNPRKSIKPSKRDFHDIGTAINAISWPATSSMTTHCGSFEPLALETRVAAGIPTAIASRASRIAAQGCQYAPIQRVIR